MSNEQIIAIEESKLFADSTPDYVNSEAEVDELISKWDIK